MMTIFKQKQISKLTFSIESLIHQANNEDVHAELADLYFERAELYYEGKNYNWAIEDYNVCLEYNPYFYEADMGREMVYLSMEENTSETEVMSA